MPVSYPMPLNRFFDLLPIRSVSMKPIHNNEFSRTRAGQHIVAEYGPTLWAGRVTLGRCYNAEARRARALLSAAEEAAGSFLLRDPTYRGPAAGAVGGTPQAVEIGRSHIRLSGLPANFKMNIGDQFSISYGSSPTRYAFHAVAWEQTANSSGVMTAPLDVTPQIPTALVGTTANVELMMPVMLAKIIPGSVEIGENQSIISEGASFEFQQVVGA